MMVRFERKTLLLILTIGMGWMVQGCNNGDGDNKEEENPLPPRNLEGSAILDVKLLAEPFQILPKTPPEDAFPGYTPMAMDLNEGTGGDFIWLYYKYGKADGSEGTPLGEIYTVDETEGEKKKSKDDTKLSINLTSNSTVEGHEIYLTLKDSIWPVVRGIVVADYDFWDEKTVYEYAPPEIEDKYPVVWVQEQVDKDFTATPEGPWGNGGQDLNEGTSLPLMIPPIITDYIYIGYCVDQEIYDWLQKEKEK